MMLSLLMRSISFLKCLFPFCNVRPGGFGFVWDFYGTRPNISKREQNALKEIKSWKDQTIRIQDKGSRFVILENRDYEQKIKYQIERSSFKQLPQDPSKQFEMKVNNWIEKWHFRQ